MEDIFLGYDRKSSGNPHEESSREDWLRSCAKNENIELAGVLIHIARKRDDGRRFTEILAKMKEIGATAIFTPWEDRLAPQGWGRWQDMHPLIRNVKFITTKADRELKQNFNRRFHNLIFHKFAICFGDEPYLWEMFQQKVNERISRRASVEARWFARTGRFNEPRITPQMIIDRDERNAIIERVSERKNIKKSITRLCEAIETGTVTDIAATLSKIRELEAQVATIDAKLKPCKTVNANSPNCDIIVL